MEKAKDPHAVALGRRGGQARARQLSKEVRTAIAKMGAAAAMKKRKKLSSGKRTELARKAAKARWAAVKSAKKAAGQA